MTGIGQEYLCDIRVQLIELGAMDLVPVVDAAMTGSEAAVATMAVYVAERDVKLHRGLVHRWLVTGPRAGRYGTMRSTRARAEADVDRWGSSEHGWIVGYADRYTYSRICREWCEKIAMRLIS